MLSKSAEAERMQQQLAELWELYGDDKKGARVSWPRVVEMTAKVYEKAPLKDIPRTYVTTEAEWSTRRETCSHRPIRF